jgi:F0F1-type ATP synthase membrane subunit b/b'
MKKQASCSLIFFSPDLMEFTPVLLTAAWIPKLFNVVVFLGILYALVRKPAREFFQTRYATIRESLERAAREKELATAKLSEINARMDRLDAEIGEIRAQSEREAAAERERIENATRQDAEKMRLTAQREIESAKAAALAELQKFTAARSVEMAEQLIRRELTAADDSKLIQKLSQEMQKAAAK